MIIFLPDRAIFNYQHYPDNTAWQLGPGPKSESSFFSLPMVRSAAYEFKLGKFAPATGFVKIKLNSAFTFNIKLNTYSEIEIVALEIGTDRRRNKNC